MAITRVNFADNPTAAFTVLDSNDVDLDGRVTAAAAAASSAGNAAGVAQAAANAAMPKAGGTFTGPVTQAQDVSGSVPRYTFQTSQADAGYAGVQWVGSSFRAGVLLDKPTSDLVFFTNVNGTTPSARLKTSGLTVVSVTQTSSFDVKDNIHAFDGALDVIDRISVVTYTYDQTYLEGDGKTRLGVLAENIEVALPAAYTPEEPFVTEAGEEGLTPARVDYAQFGPLALRAIQELRIQVKALQARINVLEGSAPPPSSD